MELIEFYHALSNVLVRFAGSANLVHVHVGMAIYIGAQLLLRTRRGSILALQLVVGGAVAGVLLDCLITGFWQLDKALTNIVVTAFWPAAACFASLHRRRRWALDQQRVHDAAQRLVATEGENKVVAA